MINVSVIAHHGSAVNRTESAQRCLLQPLNVSSGEEPLFKESSRSRGLRRNRSAIKCHTHQSGTLCSVSRTMWFRDPAGL